MSAKPFWTSTSKPTAQRLRGTHAQLLDATEDGARVLPYDRGRSYAVGELVLHPTFGLGVAVEVPAPGRVTVRFEDGDRLLACAEVA